MGLKFYSTNLKAPEVSFREALIKGLAPDGGLYMPRSIPGITRDELYKLKTKNYQEIAFQILSCLLADDINNEILMDLCRDAYNFDVPLEKVFDRTYILRLDQGPTLSFKDFAARMMARLMHFYTSRDKMNFTILTATSGDTGSAVANAFHGLSNIDVIILFPVREVTDYQRKQMTTLGRNISVIAIDGKFDDCQLLVKKAFLDTSLLHCSLTSANSINIGRLLPQSVYYFYAWSRIAEDINDKVIFSVPSGNYGNLMGGVIAREMGLPVKKFIISANDNNEVPEYLKNGVYNIISPSINCISSAMNVGHPSNLARLIALYGGIMDQRGVIIKDPDMDRIRKDFSGFSINDEETRNTIGECYRKHGLLVEPHGAVAWKGIERFLGTKPPDLSEKQLFVSLETAHPSKFREEMVKVLGFSPPIPDQLLRIEKLEENYTEMENDYEQLKEFILKR
jgi:threonine synthase